MVHMLSVKVIVLIARVMVVSSSMMRSEMYPTKCRRVEDTQPSVDRV